MSEQTHTVLMQGLSEVVERGSAVRIFRNFPVGVGGKTGTAQVGQSQSPNALFVGFAVWGYFAIRKAKRKYAAEAQSTEETTDNKQQ